MSDFGNKLRKDAAKLRGDMLHVKSAAVRMEEAASRIDSLEDAVKQFGEFLEPMRFDRKSDDARAIELDRLYRNILGVK